MAKQQSIFTVEDVNNWLEEHQNERGIANWQKLENQGGLNSYGIGLTQLRKLAKVIGRNRELSQQLWLTSIYDAKVIALLIDDPKQITEQQAEQQVQQLNGGMLVHVFSSCDATLAKSPIAFDTANKWLKSDDDVRRRCALGLIYELSKNKRNKALTDEYFFSVIDYIEQRVFMPNEAKNVRLSMGGALLGIGKRNKALNKQAAALAKKIGPIDFNEDGGKCDPFDVYKHLSNPTLLDKLS